MSDQQSIFLLMALAFAAVIIDFVVRELTFGGKPVRYKLFIDDERFPPDDGEAWFIARTMEEAIAVMGREFPRGCPDFISFDHDLAAEHTGFDFAKWLVDRDLDMDGRFFPSGFQYTIHSQNPIGAANIDGLLKPYLTQHRATPEGWEPGARV